MSGDDTCSWAKIPPVPDCSKRPLSKKNGEKPSKELCPDCKAKGITSHVQLFQINDTEALSMCKNVECTYMPNSHWESLVVKRSSSHLLRSRSKKKALSCGSSPASLNSEKITGNLKQSHSKEPSWYSVPVSRSSLSLLQAFPERLRGLTLTNSITPTKSITISNPLSEIYIHEKERKTLVPFAPFLNGHAHSFSSFQTNKLENKFQLRKIPKQVYNATSSLEATFPRSTVTSSDRGKFESDSKSRKRTCSLDSDSLSSSSSSLENSRPVTPVSEISSKKKVRQITLPPETLAQLKGGQLKLEIKKSETLGTDLIFRSAKRLISIQGCNSGESESKSAIFNNTILLKDSTEHTHFPDLHKRCAENGWEITPIGLVNRLDNCDKSSVDPQSSPRSELVESRAETEQGRPEDSDSVEAHLAAISLHIEAINKKYSNKGLCPPDILFWLEELAGRQPGQPTPSADQAHWESHLRLGPLLTSQPRLYNWGDCYSTSVDHISNTWSASNTSDQLNGSCSHISTRSFLVEFDPLTQPATTDHSVLTNRPDSTFSVSLRESVELVSCSGQLLHEQPLADLNS